jgi:hypothetical protein
MNSVVPALSISALSGLYTSAWGAFKDGPYEGFRSQTFPRSIYFSLGIALFLCYGPAGVGGHFLKLHLFHVFLSVMGLERMLTEVHKACFRSNDQSMFMIPQRMTLLGRQVESDLLRVSTGVVLMGIIFIIPFLSITVSSLRGFILTGFLTGAFISAGGAYKDAPFEGFDPRKFFRSAIVLVIASPAIWLLGKVELGFLIYAFGGLERMLVEYYKSYVVRSVPGKFRPELPRIEDAFFRNRYKLHYVALGLMGLVGVLYAQAFVVK